MSNRPTPSPEAELQRLRQEISALKQSTSWRLTAPLRSLVESYAKLRAPGQGGLRRALRRVFAGGPAAPVPAVQSFELSPTEIAPGGRYDVFFVVGCLEGESKRYRVHNLIDALRRAGYRATAVRELDLDAVTHLRISAAKVVLFRLVWSDNAERFIAWSRKQGATIIFDVDDLVFEPESVEYVHAIRDWPPEDKQQYALDVGRYQRTLKACDLVTTTTPFLRRRAERLGVPAAVIPNTVNRLQMAIAEALLAERGEKPSGAGLRLGYFSGSATHQLDFEACEAALLDFLRQRPDATLVLVGHLELGAAWAPFGDRVERHDFMPYALMLRVLDGIDINLAPLERDNPYCEGKSQLKIFEAGLVGVPTIASSTSSFGLAITDGLDGLLVDDADGWAGALNTLADDGDLRARLGAAARQRALRQWSPDALIESALAAYGLSPEGSAQGSLARQGSDRLTITWLLPGLLIGGGGHRNILRAAHHLARFGHRIRILVLQTEKSSTELDALIREHFYPIDGEIRRFDDRVEPTDVLFATHWSTVEVALKFRSKASRLMYFVQDFEPYFYPMGSDYILAENTYRLGLYAVCSGPWCAELITRDYGGQADFFHFPIDAQVYRPDPPRLSGGGDGTVLYFAKPDMPRRCFELGLEALRLLKARRPGVRIRLFGSNVLHKMVFPFDCEVLGVMPTLDDLAEAYRRADVGMVFSPTNPSLVPYEMMACGLPVVDLDRRGSEVNYEGRRDIALLADCRPDVMAAQIEALLDDPAERARRSAEGLALVAKLPSETQMARRIEQLILARMAIDDPAGPAPLQP